MKNDQTLEIIRQNTANGRKAHPLKWLWKDFVSFVYITINSVRIRHINKKLEEYENAIYKISEQKETLWKERNYDKRTKRQFC